MLKRVVAGQALLLALSLSACGQPAQEGESASPPPAPVASTPATPPASAEPAPQPETPSQSAPAPLKITQELIEAEQTPAFADCLSTGDAARGVTPAMAACIHAELDIQDTRLNAAYRAAMARLAPAGQVELRNQERAWIRARDADCQENATGGTIDRIEIPSCILNETIRRRLELEAVR